MKQLDFGFPEIVTRETQRRMEETPYIAKKFDNIQDAIVCQRLEMIRLLSEGFPIREAGLEYDRDFDTDKEVWVMFIRCFPKP